MHGAFAPPWATSLPLHTPAAAWPEEYLSDGVLTPALASLMRAPQPFHSAYVASTIWEGEDGSACWTDALFNTRGAAPAARCGGAAAGGAATGGRAARSALDMPPPAAPPAAAEAAAAAAAAEPCAGTCPRPSRCAGP
jgi:hypothetical protein